MKSREYSVAIKRIQLAYIAFYSIPGPPSALSHWTCGSYFNEHFENEESGAQRGYTVIPRSHSQN